MESIAHTARSGQGSGIKVYPLGIHIDSPLKGKQVGKGSGGRVGGIRGEITGFSVAARRRMRKAMLTLYIPGGLLLGLTLTVPWKGTDFDSLMDEFRDCFNRFCVAFRRRFPHSGLIYRVELQTRGAPHVHALVWLSIEDATAWDGGACRPHPSPVVSALLDFELSTLWHKAVTDLHHGSLSAFEKRGVLVEPIEDAGAMFRYLADHASKKKQAQLGYKGKQWGIIGKDNFTEREPVKLPRFHDLLHESIFLRLLRKVMRYRICHSRHLEWKRVPPFGSVLKGSRRSVGDFYLRQDTVTRLYQHSLALWRLRHAR